jgi:hypothetical protein
MDDNRLDAAIDDVAREMTAGEPHASFRAQVMARIEAFEVRRSWFAVRGLTAVAAIAVVLVVVLFQRRGPQESARPHVAVAPAPSVAERRVEPEPAMTNPHDSSLTASGTTTPRDDRQRIVTIVPSDVDALAPPPLDVDSIAVAALPAPSSIRLDEMETIAPIAVAPLSVDDLGEKR